MTETKLPPAIHPVDVALTFDFDAETVWMQRRRDGAGRTGLTSLGTYGAKVGIWRILDLLGRYEVPATFFVPGWVAQQWPNAVAAIADEGHEVALHAYLHERTKDLVDRSHEAMVIEHGIAALREVIDQEIVGYRPPAYEYSPWTRELMFAYGFRYGSAMQDADRPYVHVPPQPSLVEIPVKWWLADDAFGWPPAPGLPSSLILDHWLPELHELRRYAGSVFVPTLHPQLIGHAGRLPVLESLLKAAIDDGAAFRRCRDIADAVIAATASPQGANGAKE